MSNSPNPYRDVLGSRNPMEVIADTPKRLEAMKVLTGDKAQQSYGPGKWTAAQILAHLADCEIAFAFRLRQALADDNHVIQPFDQDGWAKATGSPDAAQSLAVYSKVREWNIAFLQRQPPEALAKSLSHPERGPMVFGTIVETMAGHDLNHFAQLETIAGHR